MPGRQATLDGGQLPLVAGGVVAVVTLCVAVATATEPVEPLEAAVAFSAKTLCSGVFVSRRTPEAVTSIDLRADRSAAFSQVTQEIDYQERSVTSSYGSVISRKAIYREGLGCTLVIGVPESALRTQTAPSPGQRPTKSRPWPEGEDATIRLPAGVDGRRLAEAVDAAFDEPIHVSTAPMPT